MFSLVRLLCDVCVSHFLWGWALSQRARWLVIDYFTNLAILIEHLLYTRLWASQWGWTRLASGMQWIQLYWEFPNTMSPEQSLWCCVLLPLFTKVPAGLPSAATPTGIPIPAWGWGGLKAPEISDQNNRNTHTSLSTAVSAIHFDADKYEPSLNPCRWHNCSQPNGECGWKWQLLSWGCLVLFKTATLSRKEGRKSHSLARIIPKMV